MPNKNEKLDVSTKEQTPLTDLKSVRSDLLCKIDLLIEKRDNLQHRILMLDLEQEGIVMELNENLEFISDKILKHMRPDLLNRLCETVRGVDLRSDRKEQPF